MYNVTHLAVNTNNTLRVIAIIRLDGCRLPAPHQAAPAPPHTCLLLAVSPARTVIPSLLAARFAKLQRGPLWCSKQVLRRISARSPCIFAVRSHGAIHFSIWSPAWDKWTDVDGFCLLCDCEHCLHLAVWGVTPQRLLEMNERCN